MTRLEDPLFRLSVNSIPVASRKGWLWRGWRSVIFLPNGELVAKVKLHKHLQPLLADPASTERDVNMKTQPESIGNNPIGSLYHWSFYTQGVFYYLSASGLPRDSVGKSQSASKSRRVQCRLRCEDLSNFSSEDYITLQALPIRKLFVAYKVGQTDYKPNPRSSK